MHELISISQILSPITTVMIIKTINAQRKAINRKNARIQQEDNSKINKVPGLNLEEARLMPLPCQMSPSSIDSEY